MNLKSSFTLKQFWSSIRRTATECVQLWVTAELVAEAKVSDLDIHVFVQQKILSLQYNKQTEIWIYQLNNGN